MDFQLLAGDSWHANTPRKGHPTDRIANAAPRDLDLPGLSRHPKYPITEMQTGESLYALALAGLKLPIIPAMRPRGSWPPARPSSRRLGGWFDVNPYEQGRGEQFPGRRARRRMRKGAATDPEPARARGQRGDRERSARARAVDQNRRPPARDRQGPAGDAGARARAPATRASGSTWLISRPRSCRSSTASARTARIAWAATARTRS